MSFVSIQFIVLLLITFSIHQYCHTYKTQNLVLLISSIVFYGWFDWRFLGLLLGTVLLSYLMALKIENSEHQKTKKIILIIAIIIHLGVLGTFKYYNFFRDSTVDFLSGFGFNQIGPGVKIVWPIGLSFYILQSLGYVADVYRKRIHAEKNLLDYTTFICFFAQLVAGPIETAKEFLPQVKKARSITTLDVEMGVLLMMIGYALKMIVSDNMAVLSNETFATPGYHTGIKPLFGLYAFAFQLYTDFAGYSMIALGLGRLFGIYLARNFQRPYLASSPIEFWRRWHISMGRFLKDNVLIPLHRFFSKYLDSKKSAALSFMLMHMINGLWHGSGWNYLVWGACHGIVASTQHSLSTSSIGHFVGKFSGNKIYRLAATLLTFHIWVAIGVFFVMRNMQEVRDTYMSFLKPTNRSLVMPVIVILIYGVGLMLLEFIWELRNKQFAPMFMEKAWLRRAAILILYLIILFGAYQESREFAYFRY